jgi:uncharacterized protein YbaR (Trm112 family)
VKEENQVNEEIPVLLVQREIKGTREKKVIKAIREKLVQLVLWVLKVPKENKAYPVKTEFGVMLDLKAPLAHKVRLEKREIKVIEDLWALKVLLDQEEKMAQLDQLVRQEKMEKSH